MPFPFSPARELGFALNDAARLLRTLPISARET